MSSGGAFAIARATLGASLGLYARHFGVLTLIALGPAVSRVVYFLFASGSSRAVGLLEGIVGLLRLLLFFYAYQLAWRDSLPSMRQGAGGGAGIPGGGGVPMPAFSRPSWSEVVWHALVMAAVFLVLNWVANILGGAIASLFTQGRFEEAGLERSSQIHEAARYGLKNLFIIPLWMVHLLVVLRSLFLKG